MGILQWKNELVSELRARDNSKLREPPKALNTTFVRKLSKGTRLIAENNGKKFKDDLPLHTVVIMKWKIRIQTSKSDIIRIWGRFRDYNGLGPRSLINFYDALRYSPASTEM
jgi:hypothetical protein